MTIHDEIKMYWHRVGEKQRDAIQAQHVNIEFPRMCIDKSSNKEVSGHGGKGISLRLCCFPSAIEYYSQRAAIAHTHISHYRKIAGLLHFSYHYTAAAAAATTATELDWHSMAMGVSLDMQFKVISPTAGLEI